MIRPGGEPARQIGRAAPSHHALALQRIAGNRATRAALQRAVLADEKVPMVRFTVGVEIAAALAALAWSRTSKGALDDFALAELRQLALQSDETIDDDERLFIAALLDARNAQRLHAMLPQGFTADDPEISFPVQWISPGNRGRVRDFGRSALSPDAGASFASTVRKALALADSARIRRADVQAAMIAAASDSTPGDRAFAAAVYVIARRAGLDVAGDLLAGRIKVDEVPATYIDSRAAAQYQTGGSRLKGDTIYLPSSFDVEDLSQQGTVVHELTHASDDKAANAVSNSEADRGELHAFRAQAAFYLGSLSELSGAARDRAIDALVPSSGEVRIYTMILEANVAPIEQYDDLMSVVGQLNAQSGALGAREFSRAIRASNAELEPTVLAAVRRLERLRPGARTQNDGLAGESVLDWRDRVRNPVTRR